MTIRRIVIDQHEHIHEVTNMYDEQGKDTTEVWRAESGVASVGINGWQCFSCETTEIYTVQ